MDERGIITVAFGAAYDAMAAHCFRYSAPYNSYPIHVVSNLPDSDRSPVWDEVPGVSFSYVDMSQEDNRSVKTHIHAWTPFTTTLYLDADTVVQRPGLDKIFDSIPSDGVLLAVHSRYDGTRSMGSAYDTAFGAAGVSHPTTIYYGAIVGVGDPVRAAGFFEEWGRVWEAAGSGRDMPALACAAKTSGVSVREIRKRDQFFTWRQNSRCVIQHEYNGIVRHAVGCKTFKPYKPFDGGTV